MSDLASRNPLNIEIDSSRRPKKDQLEPSVPRKKKSAIGFC